jgi:bifunctional DNA-binding transcriptional regulator/antitoxin component of YhaV-PrlF toxin-antitoxin module
VGQSRVSANHQITIPVRPFGAAELEIGDRIRVAAEGPGRVILERIDAVQPGQLRLNRS